MLIGTRLANEFHDQFGFEGNVALDAAISLALGAVAAMKHPEWAMALARETLQAQPEIEERVDSLILKIPLEIVEEERS